MNFSETPVACDRVLVVDDDPEALFASMRIVENAGYVVEKAASGQEAIDKARIFKPDIILLDVVMPGMDGFETCRRLKSDAHLNDIFVVLLSSLKNTPDFQAQGIDAGADGFIARPFHNKEFVSRIRSMMGIKAIEKELRLQSHWLRITLTSIGDGLIATDDEARIIFMNPVAEDLTGWTLEEANTRKIEDIFRIIDNDTQLPTEGPIQSVFREGMILELDDNAVLIQKNHSQMPVAGSAAPICNEAGHVIGSVLIFRDITEKKQSRKDLDQAIKNWEAMFNAIGQMTLIMDPHHGILDANAIAQKTTGLSKKELIGKKCFELLHNTSEPPEDCPMVKALKSGRQETAARSIDHTDSDFLVTCTPVLDDTDKIDKVIHIATDISDLKQTEKDLRESEEKYRILFKASSDANFLVDVETMKLLDANEAASKIYGYTTEEFLNMTALDLSAEQEKTAKVLKEDRPTEIPLRYHRKKDGTIFPVEITANYFTLHNRKTNFSAIRDISARLKLENERKTLEAHLQQAQKLESIGTLAGGIAHDFNNILSAVFGFSELSLDMVEKGSLLEDYLQEIYSAGKRARDLVKQILTFARQTDENMKPVRIGLLVKEVSKFLRSSVPATIEISCSVKSDALVLADPTQIHQVLMNLCTNAVQAMEDDGGKLSIDLSETPLDENIKSFFSEVPAEAYIKLTVSDNGSGIAPEIMDSIFSPYFTTKEPGEGTGLGLATVHGIVKKHQGHITVNSTVGKGTTFTVYLPTTERSAPETHRAAEDLRGGNERILFIDDEVAITRIAGQILTRLGYDVTVRTSSIEALELFRAKPDAFDLVITDMTMPNMTGDQLAKEITGIRPDVPIILCTGYSKKLSQKQAACFGVHAIVYKPIINAELSATVRDVLDKNKEIKNEKAKDNDGPEN